MAPFSLDDWRIDPARGHAARGTEIVRIDPRNMRVLQLLASRAGQVVSQSDIEKISWRGVVVTPDSVYQSIKHLRRALGERRYIETVPRKGYRLSARITHEMHVSQPPPAAQNANGHRLLWSASIALAAAVAAVVVVWLVRPGAEPLATTQNAQTESQKSYQGDRRIRQAIAYLEEQLKAQSETAGPDDPALVAILSRLSNLYLLVSDPRTSELAARRGLTLLEKLRGTRSAEGIELQATLAEALADLERYEEAQSHLNSALQVALELYGEAHETTVASLHQLALLQIARHRFEDAEQLARRALAAHRRLPEPGTAKAAHLSSTVAWALIEQGRAAEAISLMDEALAAIKPDDPPAPYLVALAHHFRGGALKRVGRYGEAEADFRTELELFATIEHVKMDEASAISGLAEARLMQGAVSEAAELLSEAQTLLKDGEGWRERKARHETDMLIQQLRQMDTGTKASGSMSASR